MASLNSWLSPGIMRAIAWALIHSLWQCLAIAAGCALLMAFSRRPALRYTIAVGALAAMLAMPATTFLLLARPPAPQAVAVQTFALPAAAPIALPAPGARMVSALQETPRLVPAQALLPLLVAAWLAGVAFFSLRFAGGFLLLERKRRQSFAPQAHILALCHQVQSRLGLTRAVRYLECNWLQAPAVIGWLKPIVLIPVTALTGLSEAQLRAVIAHELAHIRRFDCVVNLFQIFAESLLFHHPAIWWLNRRIRAERELCCDEIALSVTGDRLDYARALTVMAQWEAPPRLAMAANAGVLSERVFHILGRPSSNMGQRIIGMAGSVLFLAAALGAANALFAVAAPPIVQAGAAIGKRVDAVVTQIATGKTLQQALAGIAPPSIKADDGGIPPAQAEPQNEQLTPPAADLPLPRQLLSTPKLASLDARTANSRAPAPPLAPPSRVCHNNIVRGRVISPTKIQLQGFACVLQENGGIEPVVLNFGSCPTVNENPYAYGITTSNRFGRFACKFDVTMAVLLADPADAAVMQPGTTVSLGGDFRVMTQDRRHYLSVAKAKLVKPAPPAAAQAPAPVTPVQFARSAPPAQMNTVHFCRNRSVFGQVIAANTVALQGFTCFVDGDPTDTVSPRDIPLGACPLASTTTSHKNKCKFDVVLNVRLADSAEAAKMVPGKLVRLGGDFRVWKEDKLDYVGVANARVLFTDYYWTAGISNLPLPMGMPRLPDLAQQSGPFVQSAPTSYPPSNPAPQNQ